MNIEDELKNINRIYLSLACIRDSKMASRFIVDKHQPVTQFILIIFLIFVWFYILKLLVLDQARIKGCVFEIVPQKNLLKC